MLPASISSASRPAGQPDAQGTRLQQRLAGHLVVGQQVKIIATSLVPLSPALIVSLFRAVLNSSAAQP